MNKAETIAYIKENKRYPRTFWDYWDYFFYMFPTSFFFIGMIVLIKDVQILLALFSIFLALFLYVFIHIRLKENLTFETISLSSKVELKDLKEKIRKNFDVRKMNVDKDFGVIIAHTNWSGFSWGEKIMLVMDGNSILVNSRPDDDAKQPITIVKDRHNIKMLKKIIGSL